MMAVPSSRADDGWAVEGSSLESLACEANGRDEAHLGRAGFLRVSDREPVAKRVQYFRQISLRHQDAADTLVGHLAVHMDRLETEAGATTRSSSSTIYTLARSTGVPSVPAGGRQWNEQGAIDVIAVLELELTILALSSFWLAGSISELADPVALTAQI
jgi:hypothetical protein